MNTEDTVEYNSLRWVKKELDLLLQESQASLSVYIEDNDEVERLRECIEHLHMVQGTLQMVELYGAAQLAEEMEQVATALLNGELEKNDDAYDVLMRSMLQLPDYLESLQAGNKDVPMVLLPLLNDLRASRKASLLSESVLFFPDMETSDAQAEAVDVAAGQLLQQAKKLRPHYQIGLLGWFKGQKVKASLKRLQAVLQELETKSAAPSTRRLWSIGSALIDGLLNESLDASLSVKMLLGHVDRSIKQLIDQGEENFSKKVPGDLLKNLLYYIARVTTDTPRIQQIKETYRLAELLPGDSELEEARSGLGGLNAELLRTVSQGIREDMLEVKDVLEIFVHSDQGNTERLKNLPELLNKIADTLAMLGLGAPREDVLAQRGRVENLISSDVASIEDEVMGIASVLLTVESQLNNFIANRSVSGEASKDSALRVGDLAEMPEAEYNEVLSAVIREALQDFSDARQAILGYLENNEDKGLLKLVVKRLNEVNGAMFMLPLKKLEPQIDAIRNYISRVLLGAGQTPDQKTQDDMADVVTSIEYYLESVLDGRPDLDLSLQAGEEAAGRLEQLSTGYDDVEIEDIAPDQPVVEEKTIEAPVEQAVSKPTTASPSTADTTDEQRFVILGDDADEEILEIFIEEALEELSSLNEQFPLWRQDNSNEEALTTIRRSFHTLKGSGRLIGAELIGEFSWAFENLLNRVIEKSRPLDQDVFNVLEEALGVLPQLIEQLKGNQEPVANVYQFIDQASKLAKINLEDGVSGKKSLSVESEEDVILGVEAADDAIDDLADLSAAQETIEIEFDVPEVESNFNEATDELFVEESTTSELDDFDIDLTDDLEALQIAVTPERDDDDSLELDTGMSSIEFGVEEAMTGEDELEFDASGLEDESAPDIHIDPVLFKIFKDESEGHLAQIKLLLNKHYQGEEALIAGQELIRAWHTLYGSARTAEVEEIAVLCGALEKYVRLYQDAQDVTIKDNGVKLIDDVQRTVATMLAALSEPGKRLQPDKPLLGRIESLSAEFKNELEAPEPIAPPVETIQLEEPRVASASPQESMVSYGDVDEELVDIFLEEAEELLDSCENSLQRWNNNNNDSESVNDLQRHLHTLKGGARMADLTPIGDLTHALESLIIAVNEGRVGFARSMSNVLHESMDRLSDMLAKVKKREPLSSAEQLVSNIDALRQGKEIVPKSEHPPVNDDEEPEPEIDIADALASQLETFDDEPAFELEFDEQSLAEDDLLEPDETIELDMPGEMLEPEISFEEPAIDVSVDMPAETSPVEPARVEPAPIKPAPPAKTTADATNTHVLSKDDGQRLKKDEPVEKSGMANEQVRVRTDLLNELVNHAGEVSVYHARMGQQINNFGFSLSEMDQTVIRLREQLRKLTIETEAQILSRYEKESDQYGKDFDPLEMDRFSTMQQISRSLQETVGDIESIKDILGEDVRDSETLLLQESRVSTELQEGLMRTRMVHFGGLASRLRRIVRQTARELGKDVELEISGETSEVDRTVLDRIVAPLEHMLRNAVSHGIELPDVRVGAGKAEIGNLHIGVDREGGDVVIKVVDDGRGIDVAAVRKRATERGLLETSSKLSDHDVLQFIMQPGFSTAEKVTQISGRGVGMDVVDSEIKQLGGVLEIDTVQGKGTTFIIRLPLTLAINHALLVSSGEEIYAVPLNSIEGVVRLSGPELQVFYDSGDRSYEFASTSYELKHLGYILTGQQASYARSGQLYPVLLAHVGDQRVALHVDELLGRREIVVKPVGPQISTVRGISGATILGDGRVVLILEMNALVLGDSLFHIGEEGEPDQPVIAQAVEEVPAEKLVMVVDDSITIRKVTERMLARHGMEVITAKDGVDAVAQLQDRIPDVMLLDIEMPRMDGYEVATHVRNDKRLKDLPIIMITSRSGAKHRDKAMEIGVNKYLGKPYQEDELMENIHDLIG